MRLVTMENKQIVRRNPPNMYTPVGHYSHITKIPRNAELYVSSGQIGITPNGELPQNFNEQIKYTFSNIQLLLESEQLSSEHIIKVNIWATEHIDWDYLYAEWEALFGSDYPSMTVGYLSELGLPDIKIEIELWAAKV